MLYVAPLVILLHNDVFPMYNAFLDVSNVSGFAFRIISNNVTFALFGFQFFGNCFQYYFFSTENERLELFCCPVRLL